MGYRSANTIFITSAPLETGPQAAENGVATVGFSARASAKRVAVVTGRCSVGVAGLNGVDAQVVSGFTHITVTRDYDLATGIAPTGTVTFTPSAWLVNNGVTVPAAAVAAPLDVDGRISIDLAANTSPGTAPVSSYYTVREDIRGQPRRTYRVQIPHNAGSPIELSGLPVLS